MWMKEKKYLKSCQRKSISNSSCQLGEFHEKQHLPEKEKKKVVTLILGKKKCHHEMHVYKRWSLSLSPIT